MQNKENIPEKYIPYDKIILCGNTLIKVIKIIDDKGFVPIFIGKDETNNRPKIWLNAKSKDGVIQLVDENKPLINIVTVNIYKNENQMDVIINNQGEKHILLQIEKLNEVPKITKFDLRTIGYNIYGNELNLNIGQSKMTGSTFQTETLIRL